MTTDPGMQTDDLNAALTALGEVLAQRGSPIQLVLVGGANLMLRGVISRPTKDADVLGERLSDGRNMVCFKLYAAADRWPSRDRHLVDLEAISPDGAALRRAATWCRTHDPSPAFAGQLQVVLAALGVDAADD